VAGFATKDTAYSGTDSVVKKKTSASKKQKTISEFDWRGLWFLRLK
jgi:hypothetical protein